MPSTRKNCNGPTRSKPITGGSLIRKPTKSAATNPLPVPIVVGDEVVAVLNVVSTEPAAFLKGDLTYIELLGALIALSSDIQFAADMPRKVAAGSSTNKGA
jgi:hypothetical protein